MFKRIAYKDLNAKQKENYNFQKVAAELADYGFYCMWLNDDWQGADFIASHIDGEKFLRIQLKSRLHFDKKYIGKNVYITFNDGGQWYIYPHDQLMNVFLSNGYMSGTASWDDRGVYNWNSMTRNITEYLSEYKI